jgi:hypothetical protein
MPIYQSDPNAAPDSDFVSGELHHLVAGNRGRLLDARRTPVEVIAVDAEMGDFEVELRAFEDAGVRWELALDEVHRFQFARGAAVAAPAYVAELRRAQARFDRDLHIECTAPARRQTLAAIAGERRSARDWLSRAPVGGLDLAGHVERREGSPELGALRHRFLSERGLEDLDGDFAATFVGNPRSGELIKGYAIVLAELGLCPYRGRVVRDPALFSGTHSTARLADHLIVRLAFIRELWRRLQALEVTLYRAAAVDGPLPALRPSSFVSATFSAEVAEDHFLGGRTTRTAVMWRATLPIERLLMTFLETPALNERYREAEAILIADPANRAF